MKFAVAGASGFIGNALVRELEAGGHEVLRLVRRPVERRSEVEWHPASSDVEPRNALEGLDGIVNFGGSNLAAGRWTAARKGEILQSRIVSTRTLVSVMSRLNHRPPVFVCASAVGYYGNRADEWLTEGSGRGEGFLADVCHAWEEEARIAESAGIRTVMLRVGMVLGRRGGALARMVPVFRAGCGGPLGDGRQWVSWISLVDLVGAVRQVLLDPALAGPVNAVAPNPVRNAEFSEALARALGRRSFVRVPAFVLRAIFREMADEMLLASARVGPQRLVDAGFRFAHPDIAEALSSVFAEK
jgi:hypothetical protein